MASQQGDKQLFADCFDAIAETVRFELEAIYIVALCHF